ncbi:MAG: translation initiation factor IF-3 [Ruminococcus sp.]|nr:translation initiation factor IF-3 [Ruminococcus sp.]
MHSLSFCGCGSLSSASVFVLPPSGRLIHNRRCTVINNKDYKINEDIREREVRVVDSEGNQLGVMATKDALEKAYSEDKDLVKIAPNANPPVCKIMDYGKFLFEQQKREKEARRNQKVMDVKEIKMSSTIDTHDFETKVNQARKFLGGGDRLKVEVRFRKRTVAHPQFGEELLKKFAAEISDIGVVDKQPKMEGRSFLMFVSPKSNKQ